MMMVRFEDYPTETVSEPYGPYEFVQLTHEALRVGPDGEELAFLTETGMWKLMDEEHIPLTYSDVILYSYDQEVRHG